MRKWWQSIWNITAIHQIRITIIFCWNRLGLSVPSQPLDFQSRVVELLIGVLGGTVGAVFAALPKELVLAIAGLALLGTIGNGLAAALTQEKDREPALITFLVTASGVTLFGIGAAFWGLIAGTLALGVLQFKKKANPHSC